jgi:hypothetical protein
VHVATYWAKVRNPWRRVKVAAGRHGVLELSTSPDCSTDGFLVHLVVLQWGSATALKAQSRSTAMPVSSVRPDARSKRPTPVVLAPRLGMVADVYGCFSPVEPATCCCEGFDAFGSTVDVTSSTPGAWRADWLGRGVAGMPRLAGRSIGVGGGAVILLPEVAGAPWDSPLLAIAGWLRCLPNFTWNCLASGVVGGVLAVCSVCARSMTAAHRPMGRVGERWLTYTFWAIVRWA